MAWRESCRSDRDTGAGAGAGLAWRQGGIAQSRFRFASAPGSKPRVSALLRVAAQGVWVPVLGWFRAMATASRWVSREPAENA
jgi:uncharacterized caspase-like protein